MEMEKSSLVSGSLGGKVELPCHFSIIPDSLSTSTHTPFHTTLASLSQSPEEQLRIKWTKLEKDGEKLVLVAQGGVVKVEQDYKNRVSVPRRPLSIRDASLMIVRLRASDAGLYRCELMHGIEDIQGTVNLNVTGELCSSHCTVQYSRTGEHSVTIQ